MLPSSLSVFVLSSTTSSVDCPELDVLNAVVVSAGVAGVGVSGINVAVGASVVGVGVVDAEPETYRLIC